MPTIKVSAGIKLGAKLTLSGLVGYCNRCGYCCIGIIDWRMTQTDPLNPKGQLFKDKCVYLVGTPGHGTTSCKIMAGDVDIATIPEFHRNFYNNECIDYPNKNDPTEWSGSGVNIKPIVDGRGACAFRRIIINIGTGS